MTDVDLFYGDGLNISPVDLGYEPSNCWQVGDVVQVLE